MTRIPKCADLILNKVSGAPGFWIGNVIVMAGVSSIMRAMLDEVGSQFGEMAKANPAIAFGSYPFFDPGPNTNVVLRARDIQKLALAKRAVEERAIIDALNALRRRYTYVFTTGGIGPTHGDITADCVAKAFGVPIDSDPRALAILHEWMKTTGAEMNEARLRMTRIPKCADLILNKVSGAPGFWIGNVIVMAGVPSIMQAMLDEVAPKLKIGIRMLSETVRADAREGDIGMQLGEIAKANPASRSVAIRSSIRSTGPIRMSSCAPAMHRSLRLQNASRHAGASPASTIK